MRLLHCYLRNDSLAYWPCACPLVESHAVQTVAGDGVSFTYNPVWVAETSHDELKGSIAHIVFACALKHHTRRGERDFSQWQKASRYATAPLLEDQDLWVPDDVTKSMRGHIDDLPVEVIFDRLPKPDPNEDQDPDQASQPGQGDPGQGDPGQGDPGQGADMPGEVLDAPAGETEEQDRIWDKAAKQARQATKAAGHDAGSLEAEFEGQHDYREDWTNILREYMRAVAPSDYSWSRPNRRFIDSGLYLPSLAGEGMGPIVVAIDTSGSVDDDHVNRVCAEIFEIARDVSPERIHVIQCDTKIQDVIEFDSMNAPDELTIKGRGGTHFAPVFDHIEAAGLSPDLLIYMTDMGNADDDPLMLEPDYPVIWATETDDQAAGVPFGQGLALI